MLRYVVRDLPLQAIHPEAFRAAEATHCARDQGKYWEMHARLFASPQRLGRDELAKHARAIGLDRSQFDGCLASGKHGETVNRSLAQAEELGVTGTPTFFLGVTGPGAELKATKLVGAQPYPAFKAAIDRLLAIPK